MPPACSRTRVDRAPPGASANEVSTTSAARHFHLLRVRDGLTPPLNGHFGGGSRCYVRKYLESGSSEAPCGGTATFPYLRGHRYLDTDPHIEGKNGFRVEG